MSGNRLKGAMDAMNPNNPRWPPKKDWDYKIVFAVEVLSTKNNELYIKVDRTVPVPFPLGQTLWVKLIGPMDAKRPLKEQLEGVGPWMAEKEQTPEEMSVIIEKRNLLALDNGFFARIDLSDLLGNEQVALAAIAARDLQALRAVCPDPRSSSGWGEEHSVPRK